MSLKTRSFTFLIGASLGRRREEECFYSLSIKSAFADDEYKTKHFISKSTAALNR